MPFVALKKMAFTGAINAEVRKWLGNIAPALSGSFIVVGCSGNFTVEQILCRNGNPGYIRGNDVSLYKLLSRKEGRLNYTAETGIYTLKEIVPLTEGPPGGRRLRQGKVEHLSITLSPITENTHPLICLPFSDYS